MKSSGREPPSLAPYAWIFLLHAAALAIVGGALFQHWGFPLDDSWIHQSIGRNLARFGSLGYLPNQRSSGSTSLMWTLILAANYRLVPALSPVVFTLAVNAACVMATALLLFRMALQDGLSRPFAMLVAVAPAFDGNYLWLAFTGMEHLLFIALSVAAIGLWLAPVSAAGRRRTGWPAALAAGLCMGLLGMTRPEGLVLPALLLGASILLAPVRTRSFGQIAVAGGIFLLLACAPVAVNLYGSGSLLPVTFSGRRWLLVSDAGGWLPAALRLLGQWSSRSIKAVVPFDGGQLGHEAQLGLLAAIAAVVLFAGLGVRALLLGRRWRLLTLCGWGALHALLYLLILPTAAHGGRYQPFLLLLPLPLMCLGAAHLLAGRERAPVAVPAVGLLACGAVSLALWNSALASGIDHIARTHGVVAAWLNRNLPGQKVAVFDIGRIGYSRGASGDPNLIDLGGLTDPGYTAYLYSGEVPRYLASRGIRYIVVPVNADGGSGIVDRLGLGNGRELSKRLVFRVCNTAADWRLGWIQTRNAFQCQEVDRLGFDARSGSFAGTAR